MLLKVLPFFICWFTYIPCCLIFYCNILFQQKYIASRSHISVSWEVTVLDQHYISFQGVTIVGCNVSLKKMKALKGTTTHILHF